MSHDCAQPAQSTWANASPAQIMSADTVESLKAEVEGLRGALLTCQRLATLGNLAAMAVHEFKNLLTPIVARSEAALLTDDDLTYMRKTLERTLVQSQRATAVAEHLLRLAHDQACPLAACSVAAAVREAVETMTRPCEKDSIDLRVFVPEGLQVRAQADLLVQVLLNLLLNARHAMKDVTGVLKVSATRQGNHIQIDVQDSGHGIAPETLEAVFNPFLAADPHQQPEDWQQVGLGLSACRMITFHHGATIRVLANADRGCTFRLCWPISDESDCRTPGHC
jgi:signal transduction histidine kinase